MLYSLSASSEEHQGSNTSTFILYSFNSEMISTTFVFLKSGQFSLNVKPKISTLGKVRISTLRNENETFSQLNSITYIGVFLRLVTYSHLP